MKSLNCLLDHILFEILLMKKKKQLYPFTAHLPCLAGDEGYLKLLCFTKAVTL